MSIQPFVKKYGVAPKYDYTENSIYKIYLACDAVSDEILLSYHYRCSKKIIEFNNKKYYNGRLKIKSEGKADVPLLFSDIQGNTTVYKNTASAEADKIVQFAKLNKDKSIGVITPFTNQRDYNRQKLPVLAIELDGKEHIENKIVRERDRKKNQICRDHGFELIRVENSYARRYNFIKGVLIDYFGKGRR